VPYINGVSSVKQIALLADAEYRLTRSCIKHLLYYGCLLLLDIFSFSAIYAPTAEFSTTIASDEDMQRECARYVNTKFAPIPPETVVQPSDVIGNIPVDQSILEDDDDIWPVTASGKKLDGVSIVQLFAALRQGMSVREWYTENSNALANIDLRRFITFGVIKGFVYRVHKYAFLTGDGVANGLATQKSGGRKPAGRAKRKTTIVRSMSSELQLVQDDDVVSTRRLRHVDSADEDSDDDANSNEKLRKYLDGVHCFDQICTALEISEKELLDRIKRYPGEVLVIHR
jgi:nitrogen permease regulator 2-like protein